MHPAFWIGYWFIVGAFVGSFLNVVVYRLPRNCLSINNPRRSFCPSCKTQLKWNDNIPIVGYVLLRGKCRYCKAPYGARYPLVELLTALLFAFACWRAFYADGLNLSGSPLAWLTLLHMTCVIGVLLPWALIDLDLTYIPDKLTFGPLLVFVPFAAHADAFAAYLPSSISPLWFAFEPRWLNSLLSNVCTGVAAALVLWLIGKGATLLFRKKAEAIGGQAMGGADVKLMILLGVMLGWPKLVAGFFIAILVGACFGIVQLLRGKGSGTPFGPYLATGAVVSMLATGWLVDFWNWYQRLLESLVS